MVMKISDGSLLVLLSAKDLSNYIWPIESMKTDTDTLPILEASLEPGFDTRLNAEQHRIERKERILGILCGLLVVVLFSSFTLISRLGFFSSFALPDIAALRFSIGGLLLLPVFLRYRLSGLKWYAAVALAFLGGLGFALFAYTGFYLAPASHGGVLLHGTLPLLTFLLVRLIFKTEANGAQAIGLVMIAFGIMAMAWDSCLGATASQLFGDASLLLASACWSGYGVLARRLEVTPIHSASIVAVFSMCCFMPIYLLTRGKTIFLVSWHELLLQGIFQGVLIGALSIFIYTRAVASLGAVETAMFTAAVPCVTTIAAIFLLSEYPSPIALFGVAVVTIGMSIFMRSNFMKR